MLGELSSRTSVVSLPVLSLHSPAPRTLNQEKTSFSLYTPSSFLLSSSSLPLFLVHSHLLLVCSFHQCRSRSLVACSSFHSDCSPHGLAQEGAMLLHPVVGFWEFRDIGSISFFTVKMALFFVFFVVSLST